MITDAEQKFLINNIFLNKGSDEIDIEKVDMKYLWKSIEIAIKGSLHPEPRISTLSNKLKNNIKESMITVGICFLDYEKLVVNG